MDTDPIGKEVSHDSIMAGHDLRARIISRSHVNYHETESWSAGFSEQGVGKRDSNRGTLSLVWALRLVVTAYYTLCNSLSVSKVYQFRVYAF